MQGRSLFLVNKSMRVSLALTLNPSPKLGRGTLTERFLALNLLYLSAEFFAVIQFLANYKLFPNQRLAVLSS